MTADMRPMTTTTMLMMPQVIAQWSELLWRTVILLQVLHCCIGDTLQLSIGLLNGRCHKNISIKYQVPVTRMRPAYAGATTGSGIMLWGGGVSRSDSSTRTTTNNQQSNEVDFEASSSSTMAAVARRDRIEQYVDYEEHTRWDTIRICCPGYRAIVFGLCAPICSTLCPVNSYCIEPERCACVRGYAASHHTSSKQQHQLLCRPNCTGGCPEHSHCVGHNRCRCRLGYRDVSHWFDPLRCERWPCPGELQYSYSSRRCLRTMTTGAPLSAGGRATTTEEADISDTAMADLSIGDSALRSASASAAISTATAAPTTTSTSAQMMAVTSAPATTRHYGRQLMLSPPLEQLMLSIGEKLSASDVVERWTEEVNG